MAGNNVSGTLATLAAPGYSTDKVSATIDWGDGTTTPGILSGTAATPTSVNGLYSVVSDHTYAHHGSHTVTVTASATGVASATVQVTVNT